MNKNHEYLIQTRDTNSEVVIQLSEWVYKKSIFNQYIEHPKSLWLIWNYYKRIGLKKVILKLRSRFSEKERNKKIAGIFLGNLIEAPDKFGIAVHKPVLCFAPNHNSSSPFIVVNKDFILEVSGNKQIKINKNLQLPHELKKFIAWNRFSGVPHDMESVQKGLKKIEERLNLKSNEITASRNYFDRIEKPKLIAKKPTAVLFGLGNYAKTSILPNIKNHINLQRVHEVDPLQLSYLKNKKNISIDTSSEPRPDLRFDVWFIAGFHHTHAKLAIDALKQNACPVIEKPLVTNVEQYLGFSNQISKSLNPRFYSCFHKRYSELHEMFKKDFGITKKPIDMHCIVYEIPLPIHHWYNWPNSGSRLISNGCHWLDYFMFLNDFSKVVDMKKWIPRGEDIIVQVKLENNAFLSLSLTDSGSQRLGVRDYIELRSEDKTYKMIDSEYYQAEDRRRVFSKCRVNPLRAYSRMYSKISENIAENGSGDSIKTLRSTKLMLDLENI